MTVTWGCCCPMFLFLNSQEFVSGEKSLFVDQQSKLLHMWFLNRNEFEWKNCQVIQRLIKKSPIVLTRLRRSVRAVFFRTCATASMGVYSLPTTHFTSCHPTPRNQSDQCSCIHACITFELIPNQAMLIQTYTTDARNWCLGINVLQGQVEWHVSHWALSWSAFHQEFLFEVSESLPMHLSRQLYQL